MRLFRENFAKRRDESNKLAQSAVNYIEALQSQALESADWRRALENIIYCYNSALAKGMLTTSPMATGGNGERGGKESIRRFASTHIVTPEEDKAASFAGENASFNAFGPRNYWNLFEYLRYTQETKSAYIASMWENLEQEQQTLMGMPLDGFLMPFLLPDKTARLVDLPDVEQILDSSSAKALTLINGGKMDIPAILMQKIAYIVSHMKSKYREKEVETRQWLLDHPQIWLLGEPNSLDKLLWHFPNLSEIWAQIASGINAAQNGPGNQRLIATAFLNDSRVQADFIRTECLHFLINEFSPETLKILRQKYWHTI